MASNHAYAVVGAGSDAAACVHLPVVRFDGEDFSARDDAIVQEDELVVTVNGVPYCEMTCSPWDVEELVAGTLFLSGRVDWRGQVRDIVVDRKAGTVAVVLDDGCSYRGIKALHGGGVVLTGLFDCYGRALPEPVVSDLTVSARAVVERIAYLEDRSLLFRRTGGVHSAVLANEYGVVAWFEDIGRHSALDKLAGWCFLNDVDASDKMLLFSGRVPREIILKVVRLGCPVIASPGAPTNLSIRLAQQWGVTLVGFAKHGSFNVYAHPERIV